MVKGLTLNEVASMAEKVAQHLKGVVEEHSNTQASRPITHTVFVVIVIEWMMTNFDHLVSIPRR